MPRVHPSRRSISVSTHDPSRGTVWTRLPRQVLDTKQVAPAVHRSGETRYTAIFIRTG